jgi:hypothetical protein
MRIVFSSSIFWYSGESVTLVFLVVSLDFLVLLLFLLGLYSLKKILQQPKQSDAPKKGHYRRKTAGNSSLPKPRWVQFIATQLIRRRQGSHGPLQTRPSIQAQSKTPHHRQHLCPPFNLSLPVDQISFINVNGST